MNVSRLIGASILLTSIAATARGQLLPPPPDNGGSGLSITAPEPDTATPPKGLTISPPATLPAGGKDDEPLLAFRANQVVTVNALIGYVNEQPIFASDIFRPLDERLIRLAQSARTVADFRKDAKTLISNQLGQIVSEALILSAADGALSSDERELRIDDLINLERGKLISSFAGSSAAAEKALHAQGSSIEKEMNKRRIQFKKELYFSRHIAHNIEVTQQMVHDEYERDPKKWQQPALVQPYTITIPVSRWLRAVSQSGDVGPVKENATPEEIRAAETQAMATAREIIAKLKGCADFAKLADEYNSADDYLKRGGKWNPLSRGTLHNTKLENFFFSLPANAIEPYLDHQADYHDSVVRIVKIGSKTDERTTSWVQAQGEIIDQLRHDQIAQLEQKKMKELSEGAAIEAVDRMIDVAVNAAVSRYATK